MNALKSKDITLLTKVPIVEAMVFPVVMYECVNWTIKKAEHQRIDAFKLRCWKRLLRVPWTARRSNQSTLKEINLEYSSKGQMLKLKLQYFGHLMRRAESLEKDWCWERLRAWGEGGGRGWDGWMTSSTQQTWVWANFGRQWRTGKPGVLQSTRSHSQTWQLLNSKELFVGADLGKKNFDLFLAWWIFLCKPEPGT